MHGTHNKQMTQGRSPAAASSFAEVVIVRCSLSASHSYASTDTARKHTRAWTQTQNTHARTQARTHTLRHLGGPKLGVAKGIAHKLSSERREITRTRHALEMRHISRISTRHISHSSSERREMTRTRHALEIRHDCISTRHISHISMGHDN